MTVRLPVVGGPKPVESAVEPRPISERRNVPMPSLFVVHGAGDASAKSIGAEIQMELQEAGIRAVMVEAKNGGRLSSPADGVAFSACITSAERVVNLEEQDLVVGVGHALPAFWKPSLTVGIAPEWSHAEWAPSTRAVADRIDLLMPRVRPRLFRRLCELILAR